MKMKITRTIMTNERKSLLLSNRKAIFYLIFYILLISHPINVHCRCRELSSSTCEQICTIDPINNSHKNCTIRALVLIPANEYYDFAISKVMPVLKIAEERAKKIGILSKDINFSWNAQDDKCEAALALINAMDGITKNCSHVIFGPVCDYPLASVGRIAKYFHSEGTPIMSVGGFTHDFQKPKTTCSNEFYMLIRTGIVSFQSLSNLVLSIMKMYKWEHVLFLYDREGQNFVAGESTCSLMMQTLAGTLNKDSSLTFSPFDLNSGTKNLTDDMTREIGNRHSSK